MGDQVKQLGMVLSSQPIAEYDKRLVILTRDRGKIAAFARGARKVKSPLLACSQTFAFGMFTLYEGKNSYNVQSAEITQYFPALHQDWEKVCYASYLAEFADYYTRENVEAVDVLKLLYQSLRALEKGTIDKRLIRYIFELRMYQYAGEAFELFLCVKCHAPQTGGWEPRLFLRRGGLLCPSCIKRMQEEKRAGGDSANKGILLGEAWLYAMRYIVTATIEKLYTFRLSEEALDAFGSVMEEYRRIYVPHSFHSLDMI